jgi:DtxR family Mn-dependent transcriptional regulator
MKLEEKAEELLETLWIHTQERKRDSLSLTELEVSQGDEPLSQLVKAGYVSVTDSQVRLTEAGLAEATTVVRRHRLAERLLNDVLGASDTFLHEKACKFEHLLDRGLDENICTLLGHPRLCPHGQPIPPGRCCQERLQWPHRVVAPLSEMLPGQQGRIAYIYASESAKLQKLMSMGILPGVPIVVEQTFPSYVFRVRQSQFAVDKDIANAIYVRLEEVEPTSPAEKSPRRKRWGWWRVR